LAVPRPPPSWPPTSCINTAPSPMMQSLAIFLRPPAAVRSPTFRRRRRQGAHVCQVSSHRLNIATFFLQPPDYCQPSLQHRLRREQSPARSRDVRRNWPSALIAYCLLPAYCPPITVGTTPRPSLARPQRREPPPAYACSFWPPCFTMSRPETELWFAAASSASHGRRSTAITPTRPVHVLADHYSLR
jgi:hypothetical protein